MTRVISLLLAIVCVTPTTATGQQISKLQVGITVRAQPATRSPSRAATHWQTGAVIGAVVGAAFAVIAVGTVSDGSLSPSEILVLGGIGVLMGGVPGALIGALFPK